MLRKADNRIWPIDALRGLALLNMLAYHAMYDWVYVFAHGSSWYHAGVGGTHVWQQYICWSFIFLSGYSFSLGKNQLKNGLIVSGCALLLSVVTIGFMPSEAIWWGVLHLNGAAVLLTCLLRKPLRHIPAGPGAAVCAVLFVLTKQFPYGRLGFEGWTLAELPASWYRCNWFWLGLPDLSRFFSADYFPLIPWLFLFWLGLFAARLWRPQRGNTPLPLRPLCAVGRNTLLVYMLHQPILYGALLLFHKISG